MALLFIDKNKISLNIKVGVLEEYKPDDSIVEMYKEIEDLRKKFLSNMSKIIGNTDNQSEALKILKSDSKKLNKWKKYLNNTYLKQLSKIQEKVNTKNSQICPNYTEVMGFNEQTTNEKKEK